jgi:hypothetical protein
MLNNIKKGFFLLLFCYQTVTIAYEVEQENPLNQLVNSIRIGTEYKYTDNIYKSVDNQEINQRLKADIELSYKRQRKTNSVFLNYHAEYQDESKNPLKNSSFWTGKALVSQQVFSKNFIFGAQHERQRFIIDQSKASLSSNQTERDLLAVEQYWHAPYSERARFSLHIEHARAKFNDYESKNSTNNSGDISWQHKFSKKLQLDISYTYSENNFKEDYNTHNKQKVEASLIISHQFGLYLIAVGNNSIQYQNNESDGINYRLKVDVLIKQHFFVFQTSRVLTDSSFRDGYENELDFFKNQLLWSAQTSLTHQYTMIDERLLSESRLYFNFDESISIINTPQSTQNRGFNSQLNWKIDEQWNLLFFAHYRHEKLYAGTQKRLIETSLSGRFNITQSLYLQMSVNWEDEELTDTGIGYDETSYITRITYTF